MNNFRIILRPNSSNYFGGGKMGTIDLFPRTKAGVIVQNHNYTQPKIILQAKISTFVSL